MALPDKPAERPPTRKTATRFWTRTVPLVAAGAAAFAVGGVKSGLFSSRADERPLAAKMETPPSTAWGKAAFPLNVRVNGSEFTFKSKREYDSNRAAWIRAHARPDERAWIEAIHRKESGGNPHAASPAGARGPFQILTPEMFHWAIAHASETGVTPVDRFGKPIAVGAPNVTELFLNGIRVTPEAETGHDVAASSLLATLHFRYLNARVPALTRAPPEFHARLAIAAYNGGLSGTVRRVNGFENQAKALARALNVLRKKGAIENKDALGKLFARFSAHFSQSEMQACVQNVREGASDAPSSLFRQRLRRFVGEHDYVNGVQKYHAQVQREGLFR